jgi:MFS family permease
VLHILRSRNVLLLWLAGLVSVLGDHLLGIAIPFYIYQQTESIPALGLAVLASFGPSIVLGSWAGVLVDRWNQKWTMIIADVLRCGTLLGLYLLATMQVLWLIYAMILVQALISQFFDPAKNAIIPRLVHRDDVSAVNALTATTHQVGRLIGPVIGGLLFSWFGFSPLVLLDAVSFLLSAVCLVFIGVPFGRSYDMERGDGPGNDRGQGGRETSIALIGHTLKLIWIDWIAGIQRIRHEDVLQTLFVIEGLGMISEGIINVVWVAYVRDVMRGNASDFGILQSVFAIGFIGGGFLLRRLNERIKAVYLIGVSRGLVGVLWLLMVNSASIPLAIVLLIVNGIVAVVYQVNTQTILQTSVDKTYVGRIFGSYATTNALMRLTGVVFALLVGETTSATVVLNIAALLFMAAGALASIRLYRIKALQIA